jgi:hypothetical protein
MFIWRVWRQYIGHVYMKKTLHINMSYVFFSNSSYKHVLCILLKLFKYTFPIYSLQTLHITCPMYSLYIHVYMKSLNGIHRTCLYEDFEENVKDMFIWRVWREYIGHVYMKSLKRIHWTCLYEEFEENA